MSTNVSPAAAYGFLLEEKDLYTAAARAMGGTTPMAHGYGSVEEFLDHEVAPSEVPGLLESMGVTLPFTVVEMGNCYRTHGTEFYASARGWSINSLQGETCTLPLPSQEDLDDLISAVEFLGLEEAPPFNFHIGTLIH